MDILRYGRGSLSQLRKEERIGYNISTRNVEIQSASLPVIGESEKRSLKSLQQCPGSVDDACDMILSNSSVNINSGASIKNTYPINHIGAKKGLLDLPVEIQQHIFGHVIASTSIMVKVKKTPEHSLGQIDISNQETNFAFLLVCKEIYVVSLPLLKREGSPLDLTLDIRSLERFGRQARLEFEAAVIRLQRSCTKLVILRDQFLKPLDAYNFPSLRHVQVRKVIATDDSSYWPVKWLSNRLQGRHDSEELAALKGVAVNVCIKLHDLFGEWATGLLGYERPSAFGKGLFKEVVVIREWRVYLTAADSMAELETFGSGVREGKLRFVLVYDDNQPMGRVVSRDFIPYVRA